MPAPGGREGGGAAGPGAVGSSGGGGVGAEALGEVEAVAVGLKDDRMNRIVSLPECLCIRQPRLVSYAEVGDPNGFVAFLLLGVDSHRYMSFLLDKSAKAKGVRLICLDRPGRGRTSDFQDEQANRVLEFPEILRHFCKTTGIKYFSLVGQSVGASYALRCAQEMPDRVATTVYLISPWVPLSVPGASHALVRAKKFPTWAIKAGMSMGTAMPRLLAAAGALRWMAKGCSEEERLKFASKTAAEVLKAVGHADEQTHGVVMDALVALEKTHPLGFDYRDVSMPVHVFHGRADHMVPFPAAQWMSEEMPACTLSVKMGGTHALIMDDGVLDCVLECLCEDFKHFEAHAAANRDSRDKHTDSGKGSNSKTAAAGQGTVPVPAFSFPAHTQHFQAKGHLRCREGMLIKGWEERYFILDGYELHQFDEPSSATARRVVDLRGAVAKLPTHDAETHHHHHRHAAGARDRVFPFKLFDSKHRLLHELGASSTGDRAKWVETLTKASRFSAGSGDSKRQAALSKGLLVTTRAGGNVNGNAHGSDRDGANSRLAAAPFPGVEERSSMSMASLPLTRSPPPRERGKAGAGAKGSTADSATTPGDVSSSPSRGSSRGPSTSIMRGAPEGNGEADHE